MKIIVTGACGFIGYHVVNKLIKNNHKVIAIDNLNSYYDVNLNKAISGLPHGPYTVKNLNIVIGMFHIFEYE